jgi:hypothetical protein
MPFLSRLALVSLVLLAACGKADKPPSEKAEGPASAAAPAPAPTAIPDSGDAVVAVGPAAANVKQPAHAPLYPGAEVVSSVIGESGVGAGGIMTFKTKAKPSEVIAFYEANARSAGRPITMNAAMGGDVHMLTAGDSGAGKGALQVIASPAPGGSEVQMTWSVQ